MRWSVEELINDLISASNIGYGFKYRLINFPASMYRQIRSFFCWLFTGHGYSTSWYLDDYFTKTICMKLKLFRKNKKRLAGYPGYDEADTLENWYSVVDTIIEGFDSYSLLMDNADNPYVSFNSKINKFESKEWDLYFAAQMKWELELNEKWEKGKVLFMKYYSHFWD